MGTQLTTQATSLITTDDDTPVPAASNYVAVIIVTSILLVAHVPMLFALARELWSRPHYQFFVLLPLASLFLGYVGLMRLPGAVRAGNQLVCLALVMISGLGLLVSSVVGSGTLAAVSTIITLIAAIYGVGGWTLLRNLLPAVIILLPAVPVPFGFDTRIITKLQFWVAYVNGKVLDVLGAIHTIKGAGIEIPGKQLMVEEQCSGIHSFFALLTLTLFLLLLFRRGIIHSILLLFAAVYFVLLANLLRVFLCTASEYYLGYDLADDSISRLKQHSALSMAMFVMAGLLVFCTDRLLLFFSPKAAKRSEDIIPETAPWSRSPLELMPDLTESWLGSWAVGVLFALVAAVEFWVVGNEFAGQFTRPDLVIARAGESAMPARFPGAVRTSYRTESRKVGNINGEFSQSWSYLLSGKYRCEVSLDYTFTGWHDLTVCYTNAGWLKKSQKDVPTDADPEQKFVQADFEKGHLGQNGFLLFSIWDDKGERLNPPLAKLFSERLDTIMNRLRGGSVNRMTAPTYQVQIFIPSNGELSPSEKQLVIQWFQQIEEKMRILVKDHKGKATKGDLEKQLNTSSPKKGETA